MFRAVPMVRMQTIVLARDERSVIEGLGQLGAVHLMRMPSEHEITPLTPADHSTGLSRYEQIRLRIQELRQSLQIPYKPSKSGFAKITVNDAEEHLRLIEQKVKDALKHRQQISERLKEASATHERLSYYSGYDIPLEGYERFSHLHFVTGSLPVQNLDRLEKTVSQDAIILPLTQKQDIQPLLAITTRSKQQAVEKALLQAGFQYESLPRVDGVTVDGLLEDRKKEQEQLHVELRQMDATINALANEFAETLSEIEEFINVECKILEASQKFPRTESTIVISGWAPSSDVETIRHRIADITGERYAFQTTSPDKLTNEQIPVLLRHSRLLRPFEMLVSAYGLPDYRELEPTLFVALSYIIMFGMMFGDVGHGMVLALCGLFALLSGKSKSVKDAGLLLIFAGSSSIIFGVIYGSYFGIEALKKYAIWHDPLDADPMLLMYGAMGLGIALISLGLILNAVNRFQKGDIIGAVLDKFGLIGLLFYWGTLIILIKGAALRSHGLMGVALVLFLLLPILGWSIKEPLEHYITSKSDKEHASKGGMATAIMESCVEAFEAILSYLANTISFVRLAAYAMSHAALLFAAFMLAAEVKGFPYGGSIFSIVVIILGNIIAIVLEGVIASVQALRLEYYEFFGKFFSGSGQPFEPFSLVQNDKRTDL